MTTPFDYFPAPAHVATSTAPAAVVITPVVPHGALLSGASLQVRNLSGGDITAIAVDVSVDGTTYGPARSVTAGLPLAPDGVLPIDVVDTEARSFRVTLTADDDGIAAIDFLGEPAVRRPVAVLRVDGSDEGADGVTGASGTGATGASGTGAVTGASAAGASHGHAFSGTAPTAAEVNAATGTGFETTGQVVTTTESFTAGANAYAGCWLLAAAQPPCLIDSHPAVTAAPLVLTVYGLPPTTDAGGFRILRGPTPAGSNAAESTHTHAAGTLAGPSHTHTGPSHTHAITGLS